jgi:hypothetical protein
MLLFINSNEGCLKIKNGTCTKRIILLKNSYLKLILGKTYFFEKVLFFIIFCSGYVSIIINI